ncbi:MAG: NUDIX hydrolase [Microbacterium gubbeenense]
MRTAYAQLRDLVQRAGDTPLWKAPGGSLVDDERVRPAAVLILFGVLDQVPSDYDAQHRAVSRDLDVLLLTRAATLRSHPGQVAFPGGRIDPEDEDDIAAALREAREETGVKTSGIEVLGALTPLALPGSDHHVTPVVGWWRDPSPVGVVDEAESQAVWRAPVADLVNPENRVTWVHSRLGMTMRGPAWRLTGAGDEQFVWGFTAGILDRLLRALGWDEEWDRSLEVSLD